MPLRPSDRILALSGFLWFVLMGMSVTMTGPIASLMASSFGRSKAHEAQVFIAIAAGSAIIVVINALRPDWFTGRWVARFCSVCYVAGAATAWSAPSWPLLLLGYGLIGLGNGGNSFWYNAEVARNFRDRGVGAWLSALNGFWAVGAVIGPLLVGQSNSGWRWPVSILFFLAVLPVIAAWLVPAPPETEAVDEAKESLPATTYGLMILLGLYVGVETTTLTFMSRHLMMVHGLTLSVASAIASALWFSFMGSRFATGPLSLRFAPSWIVVGAALIAIVGATLSSQPGLAWPSYVLIGVAMGPVFPAVIEWGTSLGHAPHRATAIMVLGPCVTAIAFPALVSAGMGERFGLLPWIVLSIHGAILVGAIFLRTNRGAPAN